jgi:hypothetical protein
VNGKSSGGPGWVKQRGGAHAKRAVRPKPDRPPIIPCGCRQPALNVYPYPPTGAVAPVKSTWKLTG